MSAFFRILPTIAVAMTLAIAGLAGCTGTEDGLPGIGGKQPTPTPSGLKGGVGGSDDPAATPTPSPSPSPTATPSPTPTAQIVALAVSITPSSLQLSVPAGLGTGVAAGYPTSATLKAVVTLSDQSTSSAVTWVSLNPDIASIHASTGLLTVLAPGTGSGPWTVQIQAISADTKVTGTRNVLVTAEGEVAIDVQ